MSRFRKAALASLLTLGGSRALASDPTIGLRLDSAPVRSPAKSARLDANGTNQTSALLPTRPSVGWQTRLAPPLLGELATDERGRLLVAHAGDRLTALDQRGHTAWSVRLGKDLVTGPLPLTGARSLVILRDATVARVSPSGSVDESEKLPWGQLDSSVVATPTSDGGAIIAAGARLARLGPRGTRGFSARLPEPVRAVLEWRGLTLAVGQSGKVFSRGAMGDPTELASFEQPVRTVALAGDRLLGVGKRELVELELVSKRTRVVWSDGGTELHDVAAVGDGRWRVVTTRSALIDLDRTFHELVRLPLSGGESFGSPAALVADRAGRALFATSGAPVLDINPQGDASTLPGTGCPDPLRPTPVADGLVVLGCRSGVLRALSDRAR